jgi:sensor histidine kinase YesM
MSVTPLIIIVLALGIIIGGILVLKRSSKKFKLTAEQLEKINQRNEQLEKEEQKEQPKE